MYITVKSVKRSLGFKGIEITDLIIGFPALVFILFLFSFSNFKMIAVILFMITVFLLLPINLSKKNRMYKIIFLVICYAKKNKEFLFFKEERRDKTKHGKEAIKQRFKKSEK